MKDLGGRDVGDVWPRLGGETARRPWPAGTVCSAGRRGLVLDGDRTYTTLFIEVYPPGASFIRGEGGTVQEAEDACWAQYQRALHCPGTPDGTHLLRPWRARRDAGAPDRYHNGAGFCERCGTFVSDAFTADDLGQHCAVCGTGVLGRPGPDGLFRCTAHRAVCGVCGDPSGGAPCGRFVCGRELGHGDARV